jgi:membrane glycosyltransferase
MEAKGVFEVSLMIVRGLFAIGLFLTIMSLTAFIACGIITLFGPDMNSAPVRRIIVFSGVMFAAGMLSGLAGYITLYFQRERARKRRFPN